MQYIVECNGITKSYKGKKVLDNVSMHIEKGDIYGFVGENGSGKTTIIRVLTGLIFPQAGSYSLFGIDSNDKEINNAKKKLGAIVESPSIYLNMTARENLEMQGKIVGENDKEYHKKVLSMVGLPELYDDKKRAQNFSLGMRQRLGIAMTLLSKPDVLILDEPMNGLDPQGIVEIRNLILGLNKANGTTFIISSHILTELELVATKYGFISHGKMLEEITKEELESRCQSETTFTVDNPEKAADLLLSYQVRIDGNNIIVTGDIDFTAVMKMLVNNDIMVTSTAKKAANVEDYYISLVGGNKNA